MLRSDLCDYSDVYIVVKGRISVTDTNNANRGNKKLIFKNNDKVMYIKNQEHIYRQYGRSWYSHADVYSITV